MLDAYYAARGWSVDGRPTAALADRLGLAAVADDATPLGDVPADTDADTDADVDADGASRHDRPSRGRES
jgi:aldehyde:ferredoxin oxidoreductase